MISQGRVPNESGQGGDAGIPGGQVTVGWVNYGPNQNQLMANTIAPGQSFQFNSPNIGFINIGTTTSFTQTVSVPAGQIPNLDALNLTLAITAPDDSKLGAKLIAPGGESITLFVNQPTGITTVGLTGANVGVNNGFAVGTTFTDNAARSIVDINPFTGARGANAPYVGNFRVENDGFVTDPDGTTLDAFLAKVLADGNVNGTWTLQITDTNTSAPSSPEFVNFWTLDLSTGQTIDQNVIISQTYGLVIGGPTSNVVSPVYPTTVPSSPISIGPGLVMASDNTLGSFSPYEGRIYATFVGYVNVTVQGIKNPTTNTDIYLIYSDDGGRSWSNPVQVNNDDGATDGYSGANNGSNIGQVNGRSQYMPEVSVDPTTGTLVLSWRDARNDASNARVTTYVATSIDGGQTFSAQTYANPQLTSTDAITGATVVLGPMSDNESSGNNKTDAAYGYGNQMGLTAYDGQLYPIWSGNFNEASVVNGAIQGPFLKIYYQPMVFAAGPRIIDSTQGAITNYYPNAGNPISFNVTFDRPIDPTALGTPTFTAADVLVFYHDTTNGDPSIPLNVLSVTPVISSGVGPNNKFGFTQFTVTFDPTTMPDSTPSGITNFTGTYSYAVLPDVNSTPIIQPIRSFVDSPVPLSPLGPVAAKGNQIPLPVPTSGTGGSGTADDITTSSITINNATYNNATITSLTVNMTLDHQRDGDLLIYLTAPNGSQTVLYQKPNDNGVNFVNTTFSDAAFVSIASPAQTAPYSNPNGYQPLQPLANLNGSRVNGTYTLTIIDETPNNVGQLVNWSITVNSSMVNVRPSERRGHGPERRRHNRSKPADDAVHGHDPG